MGETMRGFIEAKTCCCCISPKLGILMMGAFLILLPITIEILAHIYSEDITGVCGGVLIPFNVVNLISGVLLIIGVQAEKPALMVPAILINFVVFIFGALGSFFIFMWIPASEIILAIVTFILWLCFLVLLLHWTFITIWYYVDLRKLPNDDKKLQQSV